MSLFRLDASIRTEGLASRELAGLVEQQWRTAADDGLVVRREVGLEPLPADAWTHAITAGMVAPEVRTEEQRAASALAAGLVDELVAAEAVLLAVPMCGVNPAFDAFTDRAGAMRDTAVTAATDAGLALAGRRPAGTSA